MPDQQLEAHSVGGQALIEGVMMRSPRWWAVAVRRPDGGIHTEAHRAGTYLERRPWLGKVLIRGVIALGDALSVGIRALAISARYAGSEEEELTKREVTTAMVTAVVFFIALFIVLPALLVRGGEGDATTLFLVDGDAVMKNLIEGFVRIGILLGYIVAISFISDVRRVFQYHGAEHKTIAAYEAGEPTTTDGIRPFSTIHVRCGTNFLFLVMILAVVVFSFVGRDPWWWRVISRVVLLPVVAALSYEVLRISARFPGNPLVRAITWPGLLLQRITTRPPDDDQVEVAIAAFHTLLDRESPEPTDEAEDVPPIT